ncbi:MAG: sodium:calcium antiporter [Gaiellaceae bacterium]
MSTGLAAVLFVVSLAATLYAASVFARHLDHLGARLGLPEGMLGLLTAAGADAPELSTAIAALVSGSGSVGFGVVVGSNVFNLAAMIGVSALLCGNVRIQRDALALEGGVTLAVTVAMVLLVFGVLPAWSVLALSLAVLVPYAVVAFRRELEERHRPQHVGGRGFLLIPPAVAVIVLGSVGMVHAGLKLGHAAGLPDVLIGTLVLAVVTSIPNAFTGVRLGLGRRGSALVSETFNSNTINLVGGLAIPALFVAVAGRGNLEKGDGIWLLAATAATVALLAPRGGLRRWGGAALVLSWIAFAIVQGIGR